MTNKDFITYEQASALKELGFDEPCFKIWNDYGKATIQNRFQLDLKVDSWSHNSFKAPTYQQAFRWFREKHNLPSEIRFVANLEVYDYRITKIGIKYDNSFYDGVRPTSAFTTYEEAETKCLDKLIQIVKNNDKQ